MTSLEQHAFVSAVGAQEFAFSVRAGETLDDALSNLIELAVEHYADTWERIDSVEEHEPWFSREFFIAIKFTDEGREGTLLGYITNDLLVVANVDAWDE